MSTTELPLLQPQLSQFKISRRQSVLSNYDPSTYPPDLGFAINHGLSQRVGHYIPPKDDTERCPCCLQPIHKSQLPLSCELRDLLHIGCAYPLYFVFIKQCIVLVGINLVICGIPELIINLTQGNMCQDLDGLVYSFYSLICKSSVINIMNITEIDMLEVQAIFNSISIIVSILIIGYLDVHMVGVYKKYYDDYNILPRASDYSVVVRGLPKDITLSQIQHFVVNAMRDKGLTDCSVQKIYIVYNLKLYYALYANKRTIIQEIAQLERKRKNVQQDIQALSDGSKPISERTRLYRIQQDISQRINEAENKKQLIQIQINNYEELFKMVINRITNEQPISADNFTYSQQQKEKNSGLKLQFSGKCIITLNSIQSKQALTYQSRNFYFLQKLGQQVGECLGGQSTTITIMDAPQPSEVIYANAGSNKKKQLKESICITLGLSFIILLDFVFLTLAKKFVKEEKSINNENIILSFVNSQIIALFNSIVSRVIRVSQTKSQMHSTQTSYYYSVTSKLVVLYLINMLVTTFFSNLVNYYLINEKSRTYEKFPLNFQQYLFDIFFLLITNPFVSFFLIFFDHRQIYKYFKRHQIQNQKIAVTQAQANQYYQNMQIDLSNKYSNIYRFVLFVAGVSFIFPPALIICFLTLIGFYWEDKYLLLRRYVIAHKLNFTLTYQLQKLMWYFPLLLSTTNVIIMFVPIRDGSAFRQGRYSKFYYYVSIILWAFSLLVFLGGCNWIIAALKKLCLSKNEQHRKQPKYKDIQNDFEEDYWHYYPYFRIKDSTDAKEGESHSPRKSKIDEMNKKMNMDIFSVMKNHLHHERYSPIV